VNFKSCELRNFRDFAQKSADIIQMCEKPLCVFVRLAAMYVISVETEAIVKALRFLGS
jgi:hypothetical protein